MNTNQMDGWMDGVKRDMCVSELRFVANTAVTMQIAKLDLNGERALPQLFIVRRSLC